MQNIHHGKNIKKVREIIGMKQETLAIKLDMTQQAISQLEQKEIVELSSSLINQNPLIRFYSNLEDIPKDFDIVYFGSSASHIENIYEILDFLTVVKPKFIIFDRTPFSTSSHDKFYLEKPQSAFYGGASYAMRVFSELKFKDQLIRRMGYKLFAQWDEKFQPPYPDAKSMGLFIVPATF